MTTQLVNSNVAVGHQALDDNTTGSGNVGIGNHACMNNHEAQHLVRW